MIDSSTVPLGLYVHLPWCIRKCPYCDFNSHEARGPLDEARYVDALLRDGAVEAAAVAGRQVETVFFGGGTPSLFSGRAIARLLEGLARTFEFAAGVEVTLEANPGAADTGRFAEYRAAGVNRLSLGCQSFRDDQLRRIGRVHDAAAGRAAIAAARAAGFERFNVDLMFGLPGDTRAGSLADLAVAIDCGASHVSWYQLTLEPGTQFERRPPPLPDQDEVAELQDVGIERLAAAGLGRYEVSAFATAGEQCRHNLNYWQFGDYAAVGAGAHGKLTDAAGACRRTSRRRKPATFVELAGRSEVVETRRELDARDLVCEFMLNALRLVDGVPTSMFEQRTGLAAGSIDDALAVARGRGLMVADPHRIAPTDVGLRYLNDLQVMLLERLDAGAATLAGLETTGTAL